MLKKIHLISGLPRSGSTLLCAILRQNPRFRASMTSPVASLVYSVLPKMSGTSEFAVFYDDKKRGTVVRGLFESYYADENPEKVVFDTNRTWTGKTDLLAEIFPRARIICCVREIPWIIDSIEKLLRKNPLQVSRLFNFKAANSIYGRIESLMNSDTGLIGMAWSSLREAWYSEFAKNLIVVNYESLVREPRHIMRRIYEQLGEPIFEHDFDNVIYDEPDYDAIMGVPGLHTVRAKVEYQGREPCIPPDIFAKYADTGFWLKPEMNRRGVTIL